MTQDIYENVVKFVCNEFVTFLVEKQNEGKN